jgi:hypothetical protein
VLLLLVTDDEFVAIVADVEAADGAAFTIVGTLLDEMVACCLFVLLSPVAAAPNASGAVPLGPRAFLLLFVACITATPPWLAVVDDADVAPAGDGLAMSGGDTDTPTLVVGSDWEDDDCIVEVVVDDGDIAAAAAAAAIVAALWEFCLPQTDRFANAFGDVPIDDGTTGVVVTAVDVPFLALLLLLPCFLPAALAGGGAAAPLTLDDGVDEVGAKLDETLLPLPTDVGDAEAAVAVAAGWVTLLLLRLPLLGLILGLPDGVDDVVDWVAPAAARAYDTTLLDDTLAPAPVAAATGDVLGTDDSAGGGLGVDDGTTTATAAADGNGSGGDEDVDDVTGVAWLNDVDGDGITNAFDDRPCTGMGVGADIGVGVGVDDALDELDDLPLLPLLRPTPDVDDDDDDNGDADNDDPVVDGVVVDGGADDCDCGWWEAGLAPLVVVVALVDDDLLPLVMISLHRLADTIDANTITIPYHIIAYNDRKIPKFVSQLILHASLLFVHHICWTTSLIFIDASNVTINVLLSLESCIEKATKRER